MERMKIEQRLEREYLRPDATQEEIRAFRDGWNLAWKQIMKELQEHIDKHTKNSN